MQKFKQYINRFLELVCSFLLALMLVIVLWQVFTRVVLNNPSTNTEEIVRFCLVWVSMLAGAYSVGKNAHISMTFVQDKLPSKYRYLIAQAVHVFFMLFSLSVLIYGGYKGVMTSIHQTSPSMGISMGYVFLSIPVSAVFFFLYSLINLIELRKKGGLIDEENQHDLEKGVNEHGI